MVVCNAQQVARVWAEAIAETSYITISRRSLVIRLLRRVNQILHALSAGTHDADALGREIGAALVESHFTDTAALSGTLTALGSQLTPYAIEIGRADRLHLLLGTIAAGYAQALRERTLDEQQQIHSAVLTARAESERARWESQARFQAVFAEAAIGIGIGGLDGQIMEVNQALCEMLGYDRDQLNRLSAADFAHPSDDPAVWDNLAGLVNGDFDHFRMQKAYYRSDGAEIWTDLVVSLIRDQDGSPRFAVGMVEDITERHRLVTQLRYQATHDPLTDLPNRTVFFDRLATVLSDPDPATRVGVCYLDIDGFKNVNDTLGHDAGDELLRQIAGRLSAGVAGAGHLVARMGGDEFVVLVEGSSGEADAAAVAELALAAVREPVHLDGHRLTVSASIGVVERPIGGTSAAELMKAADTTLYWAKNDGRDRFALFDSDRHAVAVSRYRLSAEMPQALDDEQFFLEYQPLIRLDDQALAGVEALVRWRHPELGLLGPDKFIELAEHSGLIVRLGRWVLQEACRQAQQWRRTHPDWHPLISVNLSPRQVAEPSIVDDVVAILAETQLPPGSLQLELTESALMSAKGEPLSTLHRIAELGVRIALDDFGTGYSNLAYLSNLPIHALKLAGPFVAALHRPAGPDAIDIDILTMLVQLAHTLKLTVTAEEVETSDQAELLAGLHCDLAQGWHFSAACSASAVTDLLRSAHPLVRRPSR
ncbi:diguanylate cyclase (GGDEF)-like protein/PAS domain S-box-containing protein [Allocatelliglobosispora scoriae]|uniref:Diguanylate cyclase (GGDEF)-like protein/PAS domain S-box-containing protein n=1 Tax=Allocatelliglobosispora scoriae TaxID=643052 RepID=A0A841BNN7_9ACTN|nr:bifunctional diguanylate cyclase/phosphodiesterase [Allocatelliglobosispora scoriae]MBB5868906.1 diguanylate cyclase (GGDEF)-like protein/PAS domain S-box-containing protein [Allocatelliglobosispora scoriae]